MNIVDIAKNRFTSKAYDAERTLSKSQHEGIIELLHKSPSSLNLQPWHFHIITDNDAKQALVPAMFSINTQKVAAAPMIVVFSALNTLESEQFARVLEQEAKDGRYRDIESKTKADYGRRGYMAANGGTETELRHWMEKQVYIALGFLLLGAAALDLNATPIEGFDRAALDEILQLQSKDLHSVVVGAVGFNNDEDFNASLPKSRLDKNHIITQL
jgi:nitroreductase / dihydropteridine reductase